jgi:hypothetical protein
MEGKMGGACSMCGGDEKMRTKFWLESLKGRDHSEDLGVDRVIILKWILGKWVFGTWTEFIWLRIGISGGLLQTR